MKVLLLLLMSIFINTAFAKTYQKSLKISINEGDEGVEKLVKDFVLQLSIDENSEVSKLIKKLKLKHDELPYNRVSFEARVSRMVNVRSFVVSGQYEDNFLIPIFLGTRNSETTLAFFHVETQMYLVTKSSGEKTEHYYRVELLLDSEKTINL